MNDLISRQAAIEALAKNMPSLTTPDGCGEFDHDIQMTDEAYVDCMQIIHELPSAQPNLSEAYSKAVFTWLMDYQIRAAELKGRYTPYEVLSWVINDWRKENG